MKKVKFNLSSVQNLSVSKKCAAVFSAFVILFTSVTCAAQLSDTAEAASSNRGANEQKILKLSESYLSPNGKNSISHLGTSYLTAFAAEESETAQIIKELSTDSESAQPNIQEEKTTEKEKATEKVTEKTTQKQQEVTVAENTTAKKLAAVTEEKTQPAAEGAAAPTTLQASAQRGYTFAQLGIKQMSDIPVPDDILFDENGIPLNYKRVISGKSTTYTMGTTTATGTRVHPGVIAVNPKIIPYGTKMYIVASDGSGYVYGYSSAEDTGGFIYWDNGPLVDMYVNSYSDSCYWGNKPVTIYIF